MFDALSCNERRIVKEALDGVLGAPAAGPHEEFAQTRHRGEAQGERDLAPKARARHQHEPPHALGVRRRESLRDRAAERVPDEDDGRPFAQGVQKIFYKARQALGAYKAPLGLSVYPKPTRSGA